MRGDFTLISDILKGTLFLDELLYNLALVLVLIIHTYKVPDYSEILSNFWKILWKALHKK